MQSDASSVEEYLLEVPPERRADLEIVRNQVLLNLPAGIVESMSWGMIVYEVPLTTVPATYNGKPLVYAGLANQKNYMSLYLMGIYASEKLRQRFEADFNAGGYRLNAGKSCIRFKRVTDLNLAAIGRAVSALTLEEFVGIYTDLH